MKPQQSPHGHGAGHAGRQVVDPFVVARPAAIASAPRPAAPAARKAYRPPAGPMHVRYMTDVRRPAPATVPVQRLQAVHRPVGPEAARPRSAAAPADAPGPTRPTAPAAKRAPAAERPWSFEERETWRDRPVKNLMFVFGGLLFGGLSLFSLQVGEAIVVAYAVVAIWRRWPSRQAFSVALGVFGGIIITSLHAAWRPLASNLAVYAFLLLCIGTVLMWLEMRRDARMRPAKAPASR